MLDRFIAVNRAALIAMAQARVGTRRIPKPTDAELTSGIPVFLDQLCEALRRALRRALKEGGNGTSEQDAIVRFLGGRG